MCTQNFEPAHHMRMMTDENLELRRMEKGDIAQIVPLWSDAFKAKRFIGCCPTHQSETWMKKRFSKRYPLAKLELSCVAIKDGDIIGMVQLTKKGIPAYGRHTCDSDEMYIETLAVSADAQCQGVGSKLLQWAERKARSSPKIKMLTLEVVRGNRAISLFQRAGFETMNALDDDCFAYFCFAGAVCCKFGRPYGCCNPEWGYFEMAKDLPKTKENWADAVLSEQATNQEMER